MKKYIITVLITMFVIYLLSAFVTLSFNPANWTLDMREFVACFAIIFSMLAVVFVSENKINN